VLFVSSRALVPRRLPPAPGHRPAPGDLRGVDGRASELHPPPGGPRALSKRRSIPPSLSPRRQHRGSDANPPFVTGASPCSCTPTGVRPVLAVFVPRACRVGQHLLSCRSRSAGGSMARPGGVERIALRVIVTRTALTDSNGRPRCPTLRCPTLRAGASTFHCCDKLPRLRGHPTAPRRATRA
jgi:hypothetical protein